MLSNYENIRKEIKMEKFFIEYPAAGWALILGLLGLIGWLIRMAVQAQLKDIEKVKETAKELKEKTDDIENNYKNEFKLIRFEANERHLEVLKEFTELKITVAKIKE